MSAMVPGIVRPVRRFLWARPYAYAGLGLLRGNGNALDTRFDVTIEGFPRSGNSFAVAAFRDANPEGVVIRSHRHMPPFAIAAARAGRPVCLLVREPEDAAISWALHIGKPARSSLESWVDYHRVMWPWRGRCCVASFADVTADFGAVMERLNRRFGTGFRLFVHDRNGVHRALAGVEAVKGGVDSATTELALRRASHPVAGRDQLKRSLVREMAEEVPLSLREEAAALYAGFVGAARH